MSKQPNEAYRQLKIVDYERRAAKTDFANDYDTSLLGLFGEVGSLLSALKKKRRDKDSYFGYRTAVLEELGDVLWYLNSVARISGIHLAYILEQAFGKKESAKAPLRFFDLRLNSLSSLEGKERVLKSALLELAAEAGELIKRHKTNAHHKNSAALRGDLIKVARPLLKATGSADWLARAALGNLSKVEQWRRNGRAFPDLFDDEMEVDEQLPRKIRMEIYERRVRGTKFVFQKCNDVLIGDRLTDNHDPEDDYRFHDVFHLAHAAILGWSPVIRALFRVKRKGIPDKDENQDGARAILIEEGLTTWIFEMAKEHKLFGRTKELGFDTLKSVKRFVKGYEPDDLPSWLWEKAILDGYKVFRELKRHRRGIVVADLNKRSIRFERWPNNSH